jgi:hypothetical protein
MERSERTRHSDGESARFLTRLLPERERLAELVGGDPSAVDILGCALWDVFSNNHTVVDAAGIAYDLGSFRGSAGFIAETINRRYDDLDRRYGYLDFYLGTPGAAHDTTRRTLYRWIFTQLKEEGGRWIYSFPRLYVVDLRRPPEPPDFTEYDAGTAVREELARAEEDRQQRELLEQLDRWHAEDLRRARETPLPPPVSAYREVFGHLPEGWPHPEM